MCSQIKAHTAFAAYSFTDSESLIATLIPPVYDIW